MIENTSPCEQKAVLGDVQLPSDPMTIADVKVVANMMTIVVQYSGGCASHDFKLVGSEYLSKSLPPIRQVALIHQSNGDLCKMLKTDTLCFDIRSLAYKQEAISEVVLNLQGWNETVVYTFQK